MFNVIYRASCFKALRASRNSLSLADHHDRCIKNNILVMFSIIRQKFQISIELHCSNARHQMKHWTHLKFNKTCLCCLRWKSEHIYICDHALCNVCIEIYKNAVLNQEYYYKLFICIHCEVDHLIAKIKSSTIDVWILSINEEDVCNIVSLKFLDLLQKEMRKTCLIQNLFNLAINISFDLLCLCVHSNHC